MEQWTGSKLGKEYIKAIYCHPAYLTYMLSTSYEMLGWMNHKLESRVLQKYQQPQICRWYHFNGRKQKGTRASWWRLKRSEKAGLKRNIQKTKIMAFSPITSCQIDGEKVETVWDFTFLGSKITVNRDCSHESKRHLFLGRKAMTNLDCIKSRDITLLTKVRLVKAMFFPVIMYRYESWTIKKADARID